MDLASWADILIATPTQDWTGSLLLDGHLDLEERLAGFDHITVLEVDLSICPFLALFRRLTLLSGTDFLLVHPRSVETAEVADACVRRIGLDEKMVP